MDEDKKKNLFRLGLIEVFIIGGVIVVLLIILSSLHILPFSLPFSNLSNIQRAPTTVQQDETGFGCIFEVKLCTQGEKISAPKNEPLPAFYGLGFTTIPSGTPIKAAISGKIGAGSDTDPKTKEKINTVSILNDKQYTEVNYRYVGKPIDLAKVQGGNVKKGEVIGVIGNGTVTFRQDSKQYSLIFFVMDTKSKEVTPIQFSDLK